MKNCIRLFGITVFVAVMVIVVAGCASAPPIYQNLGVASEDNCALIQVNKISVSRGDVYAVHDFVSVDGDSGEWRPRVSSSFNGGGGKLIVRATPGSHRLTIEVVYESGKVLPLNFTFDDFKSGMGYSFAIEANKAHTLVRQGIEAQITIYEYNVDENGNFAGFGQLPRIVGKLTESAFF